MKYLEIHHNYIIGFGSVQTFYITAPATLANKGDQGLKIDLGGPLPFLAEEDLVEKYQKFKTRHKKLGSLLWSEWIIMFHVEKGQCLWGNSHRFSSDPIKRTLYVHKLTWAWSVIWAGFIITLIHTTITHSPHPSEGANITKSRQSPTQ